MWGRKRPNYALHMIVEAHKLVIPICFACGQNWSYDNILIEELYESVLYSGIYGIVSGVKTVVWCLYSSLEGQLWLYVI